MKLRMRLAIPILAAVAGVMLATCAAAGSAGAASAGPAQRNTASGAAAVAVSNHQISGNEAAISCLRPSRCVAVGYGRHHGQVVVLINGKQVRLSYVAAGKLFAVSCPSREGCWAIGAGKGGANLVQLGSTGRVWLGSIGKVIRQVAVKLPAGVTLSQISCVSMTSCEMAGQNNSTPTGAIDVASWNGRKLHLTGFAPFGSYTSMGGISCWQTTCVAVGNVGEGSALSTGVTVTVKRGRPGPLQMTNMNNDLFAAVSCVSSSTCYAAGSNGDGIVVTLTNGIPVHKQDFPWFMFGIECAGATCRAAGDDFAHPLNNGVIVTLTNGVATGSPVVDHAVSGFLSPGGMARRGNGFAAIGGARTVGSSVVATG
jgi:hypothetical protein